VIGTASRPESVRWIEDAGAHTVIDHTRPLSQEMERIGRPLVRYVLSLTATDAHWAEINAVLAPQGQICLIDDPDPSRIDISLMKLKAGALHWEFMFTRSMFETPDMVQQHKLLTEVADLVDEGLIKTTLGQNLGTIDATNLRRAHALIENGRTIGKLVLEAA